MTLNGIENDESEPGLGQRLVPVPLHRVPQGIPLPSHFPVRGLLGLAGGRHHRHLDRTGGVCRRCCGSHRIGLETGILQQESAPQSRSLLHSEVAVVAITARTGGAVRELSALVQ